jgi:transcriptional regulator of NAD metabolism
MKNELRNIISGTSKVSNGAIIQTISSYLKRSAGTSEMAKIQKHFKKQETEVLKNFIIKNNLWVKNIDISNYVSEGAEQRFF